MDIRTIPIPRTFINIVIALLAFLFGTILLLLGLLHIWSPGVVSRCVDDAGAEMPGSIAEKAFVQVNGVRQGMFIKGKDTTNPVLLYLHGGMPDYFLTRSYPTSLDEHFTVCWWEQRGSGLSFDPDAAPETITAEQHVLDAIEVSRFLQQRFGKERIYLMGHSGGTFLGVMAAARAPELYHAYIGMAQMSDQLRSEVEAYDFMLEEYERDGNSAMVERLEAAPVSRAGGIPDAYYAVRDEAMHGLGVGTTRDMRSVLTGVFLASLRFPEYTVGEKYNLWRGKFRSGVSSVWKEMVATDLTKMVDTLEVPVYFLHGVHDRTVSFAGARSYWSALHAPIKGFYSFSSSAHSPLFEEPDRAMRILQEDVLGATNRLSDGASPPHGEAGKE